MYSTGQTVGGLKDFVKKVRKSIHKLHPRELSPTRMIDKYQSDSKKKSDAKIAKILAAPVPVTPQIPAAPISQQFAQSLPFAAQTQSATVEPQQESASDSTAPLVLAGLVGLAAIFLLKKRRK